MTTAEHREQPTDSPVEYKLEENPEPPYGQSLGNSKCDRNWLDTVYMQYNVDYSDKE